MIRGGSDQRNITVWEPGTVGNEFVKTYGHYHVGKLEETYWVLLGQGFALSQKRAVDESGQALDDKLEFFKVQSVQAGDSLHFESGEGHLFVNSGRTYLVTADDSPVHFDDPDPSGLPGHADYLPVQTMRGFAYYVVEHEGSPALVKNPRYSSIEREDLGNIPVLS
jgi:oxalate decarboxylase/phosphoglucose isomerase-like protein (cupin superfamily)